MLRSVVIDGMRDVGELAEVAILYPQTTLFVDERSLLALGETAPVGEWLAFFEDHRDSLKLAAFHSDIWPLAPDPANGRAFRGRLNFDTAEDPEPWHRLLDRYGAVPHPSGDLDDYPVVVDRPLADRFLTICEMEKHAAPMLAGLLDDPQQLRRMISSFVDSSEVRSSLGVPTHLAPVRFSVEDLRETSHLEFEFELELRRSYGSETTSRLLRAMRAILSASASLPVFERHGEDYAGDDLHGAAARCLLEGALRRRVDGVSEARLFREVVLDSLDIRGWVNAQPRPFQAFRSLYEDSSRFRDWVSLCVRVE